MIQKHFIEKVTWRKNAEKLEMSILQTPFRKIKYLIGDMVTLDYNEVFPTYVYAENEIVYRSY